MHSFILQNLKFKHLINYINIDLWSFVNVASMEDINRKFNSMVALSKFTSNKNILSRVVAIYNLKKWHVLIWWLI